METSSPPSTPAPNPIKGMFQHISVVFGVAFLVATLFTAWTPSSLLPGGPKDLFKFTLAAQTPVPTPDAAQPTERSRPLIGIVAGHSGHDSGAVCADGLTEKFINETVADYVQKNLVDQGLDVELLQEFDPRLEGYKASALVSVHADSCDYINELATGFKVAAALANPRPEFSARLTACLRSRYAQATGLPLHSTSVTDDMTSYHAFNEIDDTTPAAIIEIGFLNLDRQLLENQPEVVAQGITEGILCFIYNEDVAKLSTPTAAP